MTNSIPTWAWIILAICLILLVVGIYQIVTATNSGIHIGYYPTNLSELLSPNMTVNNTTGVVKLGS